jgi:hypothetical protein
MKYECFPPCICWDHEPQFIDRRLLILPIIAVMFVSSFVLLAVAGYPCGAQFGSLLPYTALVVLATFSAQRAQQSYFFECPFVQQIMPSLVRRHIGFF